MNLKLLKYNIMAAITLSLALFAVEKPSELPAQVLQIVKNQLNTTEDVITRTPASNVKESLQFDISKTPWQRFKEKIDKIKSTELTNKIRKELENTKKKFQKSTSDKVENKDEKDSDFSMAMEKPEGRNNLEVKNLKPDFKLAPEIKKEEPAVTVVSSGGAVGSSIPSTGSSKVPTNNGGSSSSVQVTAKLADQRFSTLEDTSLTKEVSFTKKTTYVIVNNPSNGVVTFNQNSFSYTPNANFHGEDTFKIKALMSGSNYSNEATITILVNPLEDVPVTTNQTVVTMEDMAESFEVLIQEPDEDILTYTILTSPTNGTLIQGIGKTFTYTPNANFNGVDTFSYKVNDSFADSNVAVVNINVMAVNDKPTIDSQTLTTLEDTPLNVNLTTTDIEGDSLIYIVTQSPVNGVLSGTPPNLIYTPNANFHGLEIIKIKVNDTTEDSEVAEITITVTPENDHPISNHLALQTNEEVPVSLTLDSSDPDLDPLTYTITQGPVNGVLSGTPPNLVYTPNLNFNGVDTFKYKSQDSLVDSNEGEVTITVQSVNDLPQITISPSSSLYTTDSSKDISFSINDLDSSVNCSHVTVTSSNQLVIANSDLTVENDGLGCKIKVTPSLNQSGTISLNLKVVDGSEEVNFTTSLTVIAVSSLQILSSHYIMPQGWSGSFSVRGTYTDSTTADLSSKVNILNNNSNLVLTGFNYYGQTGGTTLITAQFRGVFKNQNFLIKPWTNLTLSNNYIKLGINGEEQVRAVVNCTDGSFFDVTSQVSWNVANPSFITVSQSKIKGQNVGTTTATATYNSSSIEATVEVTNKSLISLELQGITTIAPSGSTNLVALAHYSDASVETVTNSVLWESLSPNTVKVSNLAGSNGKVEGLISGQSWVRATFGGLEEDILINVSPITLTSITVTPDKRIASKLEEIYYAAKGHYSDGSVWDITNTVEWSVTTANTVNFTGSLVKVTYTGTTAVTTNIRANIGAVSGQTPLTINPATVDSIVIGGASSISLAVGDHYSLQSYALMSDGGITPITLLTQWSSGDNNVLGVSNSEENRGQVFAKALGSSVVTASYQGKTATKTIGVSGTTIIIEEGSGLKADYYNGTNFNTFVGSRIDKNVNFDWAAGNAPLGTGNSFSVKWSGKYKAVSTETLYFCTDSDDGVRFTFDGVLVVNNWTNHSTARNCSGAISVVAGQKYDILLEFYENSGSAVIKLYSGPATGTQSVIPQSQLYPD